MAKRSAAAHTILRILHLLLSQDLEYAPGIGNKGSENNGCALHGVLLPAHYRTMLQKTMSYEQDLGSL